MPRPADIALIKDIVDPLDEKLKEAMAKWNALKTRLDTMSPSERAALNVPGNAAVLAGIRALLKLCLSADKKLVDNGHGMQKPGNVAF